MQSVKFHCEFCGKESSRQYSNFHQNKRHFCNKTCSGKACRSRKEYACAWCGEKFTAVPSANRKYCSPKCFGESIKIEDIRICKECGKEFQLNHSKGISKDQKFCSHQCFSKARSTKQPVKCVHCGDVFYAKSSQKDRRRFCSYRCYHLYRGPSSLEIAIQNSLNELGVEYEPQVMFGDFCVDFLLPQQNIVIECDGNYWHSSRYAKNRDRIKDHLLTSLGYAVHRFSENHIKTDPLGCIEGVI